MNYFAIVRLIRNPDSMKLSFSAQDSSAAMKEMLRGCKCTSTNELKEFELFEVVTEGTKVVGYRPVANRHLRKETLPYIDAPVVSTALALTPKASVTEAVANIFTESSYSPYQLVK